MSWPLDLFDKVLIVSKIHLLSESSIKWLKQQAKTLKKSKSIALSQAQYEVAVQHGFLNWKNLVDTFKYETTPTTKYRLVSSFLPDYEPIRKEAHNLYISRLNSSISSGTYVPSETEKNLLALFDDKNQNYSKSGDHCSDIWRESFLETSKKYGFSSWEELKKNFQKDVVLSEYTDEQKIGAIARNLNINPTSIKNSVFVVIDDSEDVFNIGIDEWESFGFYEDFQFVQWIEHNDPFFKDIGLGGQIFRALNVDTNDYEKAEKQISETLEKLAKSKDFFFPIHTGFIWINGKINPRSIESLQEELKEYSPDIPIGDGDIPLAEIPTHAWKRGY